MMPCCRIESINSSNASRAKSLRGCNALGTMVAKSIWCTLSANSSPSLRAATEGAPISAPRPLPRPDRAMRLRLPELPQQRKQQSAPISPAMQHLGERSSTTFGEARRFLKKILKKVLTFIGEIRYQRGWLQKQTRDFCPVGFFVRLESSDQKQK